METLLRVHPSGRPAWRLVAGESLRERVDTGETGSEYLLPDGPASLPTADADTDTDADTDATDGSDGKDDADTDATAATATTTILHRDGYGPTDVEWARAPSHRIQTG